MQSFEIVLLVSVPLLIFSIFFYWLIQRFFTEEEAKRKEHWKEVYSKDLTPQKFSAYERMALFLERIKPAQLATREIPNHDLKSYELRLMRAIQSEWEHNLSQQIYVYPETWKIIFSAKNATQDYIRQTAQSIDPQATAEDLQKAIIENAHRDWSPSDKALLQIKGDVQGGL